MEDVAKLKTLVFESIKDLFNAHYYIYTAFTK